MRDSFGTLWYTDGPDGERIAVDPEREFGPDWPGHAADEEASSDPTGPDTPPTRRRWRDDPYYEVTDVTW
jgi:hypothetical protein